MSQESTLCGPPTPVDPRSQSSMSTDSSSSKDSGFDGASTDEEEHELLNQTIQDFSNSEDHEVRTAPVVTRQAYMAAGGTETFPQRGLLGALLDFTDIRDAEPTKNTDNRIYVNTNAPFSALVCGVQGSGKSHTVSIMLENMLISGQPSIGRLDKSLSGLVLHFGDGGADSQPSEAAYIGSPIASTVAAPRIVVYVSPSSIVTMRTMYKRINSKIVVEPLLFSQNELDAKAFLSLMAVGSSESAPLYMQTILSILRELGEKFTYDQFMSRLDLKKQNLNPQQLTGLKQRMELLQSFLDKSKKPPPGRFAAGQLTIVDLSDIFIDPHSACGLFEIVTRQFVRAKLGTGKVLVVDEAHKYLSAQKRESGLTRELSSLVRQQRHLGMRVIISTQEPTVVPNTLIDLCSVVIMHRFSSPSWWEHLAKHVSANMTGDEAFDRVVRLKTGQAILLAPSGLSACTTSDGVRKDYHLYGRRWALVKTRQRITKDGGASVLVVSNAV